MSTDMSRAEGVDGRETLPPYGSGPGSTATPGKRVRVHHLLEMKQRGERWPMLTAYDQYAAEIFDDAGIPVLLVGASAANNVVTRRRALTVDELPSMSSPRALGTPDRRDLRWPTGVAHAALLSSVRF